MKKSILLLLGMALILAIFLTACGGAQPAASTGTEGEGGAADVPVPAEYAGKTNPVANNADAIAAGKVLYTDNCLSCHGETGVGDGPAGASLDPKPGNLDEVAANDTADRIFWRISEGGMEAPFNSSMPAWKSVLSEDERWQVVSYIQATFK